MKLYDMLKMAIETLRERWLVVHVDTPGLLAVFLAAAPHCWGQRRIWAQREKWEVPTSTHPQYLPCSAVSSNTHINTVLHI